MAAPAVYPQDEEDEAAAATSKYELLEKGGGEDIYLTPPDLLCTIVEPIRAQFWYLGGQGLFVFPFYVTFAEVRPGARSRWRLDLFLSARPR